MTYRIILPWLILAFFPRVCASIIRGPVFLIESAKSILLGDMTWYFPCCIISLSIWFFQNKLIKNQWLMILSPLLLGSLGFILAHEHILDFLFINNALISQIFLLLGRELKIHMASVEKLSVKTIILIFTTYIILAIISCILFPGQTMDIHTNRYYNIFLCLAMIFTGNLFLFSAASRIVVKWNPLAFIGQNSILFYLWGGYMAGFVKHFLEIIHVPSSNQILYALIVTILTCVGCGVTAIFINRYLPFVNGKRR